MAFFGVTQHYWNKSKWNEITNGSECSIFFFTFMHKQNKTKQRQARMLNTDLFWRAEMKLDTLIHKLLFWTFKIRTAWLIRVAFSCRSIDRSIILFKKHMDRLNKDIDNSSKKHTHTQIYGLKQIGHGMEWNAILFRLVTLKLMY